MVVDDDRVARELVTRLLRKLHLCNPVLEAADGEEVCDLLSDPATSPVLVFLDQEMPHRSGLEVLRWLRDRPALADLPVVMLTGSAEIDEVDAAYRLGIASYLVKPVGFAAIQDVIRQLGLPWAVTPPGRGG